jgi:AAA domain
VSLEIDPSVFGTPDPEPPDDPWDEFDTFDPEKYDAGDGDTVEDQRLAFEVDRQLLQLRARKIAQERHAAETAGPLPVFDAGLLEEILARPAEPPHRVDGLIPSQAGVLVVAQRKIGKTTFDLNLTRCLLTGAPFLGRFDVRPVDGRVGFLNYEVSGAQLARWADDVGIPRDRLYLVNLRGRRNPLAHQDDRAELAQRLRDHEVEALFVDPFGRAYTGQSQNDAGEVGAWLANLDRYARGDCGITDLVMSVHAGWDGERSRGSTALEDWADSIVNLTRDEDGVRYIRAIGRDVEVEEDALSYDPGTRMLAMSGGGSRKQVAVDRAIRDAMVRVRDYIEAHPGCSGSDIRDGAGVGAGVVTEARRRLIRGGDVVEEKRVGRGGGKVYRLADPEADLLTEMDGTDKPGTPSNPVSTPSDGVGTPSTPSIKRRGSKDGLPAEPRPAEAVDQEKTS